MKRAIVAIAMMVSLPAFAGVQRGAEMPLINNPAEFTVAQWVNPNQHYVKPYVRSDGTYVRGHMRTNPNGVCWDNLNGC